jgi:phage/plasmid-like protein (TIGR03299 family)
MRGSKAEMAYSGETPWHGLGQRLTDGATLDQWIVEAGMDWKIQRSKVRYFADREATQQLEVPDQLVQFRSDTKAALGIVSDKYKTVQPKQVMEFFRDLTDSHGFTMRTAGTLFGGRRFWALAETGETGAILDSGDVLGQYLVLATSCDGSMRTVADYTNISVVCANTMRAMMQDASAKRVQVSHRSRFIERDVKASLGIANFQEELKLYREAAAYKLTNTAAELLTAQLFLPAGVSVPQLALAHPKLEVATAEQVAKVQGMAGYNKVLSLFSGGGMGANLPGRSGTLWGLLNGVTQYVDHETISRGDNKADNKLDSALFGRGGDFKSKAQDLVYALINA